MIKTIWIAGFVAMFFIMGAKMPAQADEPPCVDCSVMVETSGYDQLRDHQWIKPQKSKIWTDHNTHDPGITLVDAMMFGLTETAKRDTSQKRKTSAKSKGKSALRLKY